MLRTALRMAEMGLLPERLTRVGIRGLLRRRLATEASASGTSRKERLQEIIRQIKESPVALVPEKANEQHYEVPPRFFQLVLGTHLKYSSGYWPEDTRTLDESEAAMLDLTCKRAEVRDGMDILELGCGWGSLTLWMAQHYPSSSIVAVSNSHGQREFIKQRMLERGLGNIQVVTCDMNDFATGRTFDRVVSIEMFEHMRNYLELMHRIAGWLRDSGKLFVHIFCHREYVYPFIDRGAGDWMARHFFTGGLMPSADLLHHFQDDLRLQAQWQVSGKHYARSCRAWLDRMHEHREEIISLFEDVYGSGKGRMWYGRWRIFFISCEELFDYHGGSEWFVAHYLFGKSGGA